LRDEVVDFVRRWNGKTEIPVDRLIARMGLNRSKFYDWRERYGKVNEHNGWIPRDHWVEDWERQEIIGFHREHQRDGYRRICYMLLDQDKVAVSPATVYRVLQKAGLLERWNRKLSKKGTGFDQPLRPHEHWHVDMAYLNICGTFYYLLTVLDGYSRYVVHWEIRETMTEQDVEVILQRAREAFPGVSPRIISDNGPQFIARDFKEFIRISGMTHVRTSPYYPQSNGKIERWHRTAKEVIRRKTPVSIEDARRVVGGFVEDYNTVRLHSAIGYVTPKDKLEGREKEIFAARDRKLEEARERRRQKREEQRKAVASQAAP
jgi:transposase InsO family protein